MSSFHRFLSVLTILTMISGPALLTHAQTTSQDDQQYDSQPDTSASPDNDQAAPNDEPALPEADSTPQVDESTPPAPQYGDQQNQQSAPPPPSGANSNLPEADPPARAARLQYMTGSISVQPQGTGDWVAGELNRPLTNSDNVWADKDSRAEISVGSGLIRIGSETSVTLTNISESAVQLQLHQGALNLHIRRLYDNEKYEVDTPNQAFTVEKPGDYRFDVNPDVDKTVITVWRGEGESTGDGPTVHIRENQQARFSNGTSMNVELHAAPAQDSFDQWAQSRDERLDNSKSARYVSPDTVGYEDLDEYGVWKETPDYGAVWYPTVSAGWRPYYDGHWVWEYPWGWTWVDYEPWGFAPFHYGRWVYAGGGWGWAPGPIYVRPYYAPALVAWFGGGWGVGVGFGGGFGWCPLGWGEPYIPWYGVSRGYFYHVNFSNGRFYRHGWGNLNGFYGHHFVNGRFAARNGFQLHYANMRRPGGFTAVSRTTIINSRSVARNRIRVSPNQMSRMTAVHSLAVRPTRTSFGSRGTRASAPATRSFSRPVVSRMGAPARGGFNRGARTASVARPNSGFGNPGPAFNNSRPGVNNSRPMVNNSRPGFNNPRAGQNDSIAARGVPRPPSAGNFGNRNAGNFGNRNIGMAGNSRVTSPQVSPRMNVPRPPSAAMGRSGPSYSPRSAAPAASPRVARPSYSPRGGGFSAPRPSAPRSNAGPRGAMNVPRPSPSVAQNNRHSAQGYNSSPYGGGFGRSNTPYGSGRSAGGYGRQVPYARNSSPAYSRPSPSYGGFGGRAPSYGRGAPSAGGGRSAGGFGGGRSMSAPRGFGGGGSSRGSFGGGGHFGGGGGHFGGGGGGGHVGGGGGGHAGGGHGGGHH